MKRGNIVITFAILIAFSGLVLALLTMTSGEMRSTIAKESEVRAFFTAQAGLSKGIWYVLYGGAIPLATSESFENGQYSITVADIGGNVVNVTSIGTNRGVTRTLSQNISTVQLPAAFNYGVYTNNSFSVTGNVEINGDLFVNGNSSFGGSSSVTSGEVYHPSGSTVSGNATDGGTPSPLPSMPTFETTTYDSEIALAGTISSRSFNFTSDIDLTTYANNTLYVNGSISISGDIEIIGPGAIVATGTISMLGDLENSGTVSIISGSSISCGEVVDEEVDFEDLTIYARTSISISSDGNLINSQILTPGSLSMSGSNDISGLVFCGGSATLTGSNSISGALVASRISKLAGTVNISYSSGALGSIPATGFTTQGLSVVKGSWRQL